MVTQAHYAVVVVGSGPVGLTLVNLLGTYGVRTLLIERNETTVQEPRAVSIDDESLRTMQAAGVVDEVLRHVVPGYGSHYYSPGRLCFAKVLPTGRIYGYPRRNAFRQPILESQLREALGRFGHVETRYGWQAGKYEQLTNKVALSITGPDGVVRQVTCDYLVGCDGAGSPIREQQGIQLKGTTFEERWLIIDLENNENTTEHTEVYCDALRPGITLPGPDRTRRYEFKLVNGESDEDLLDPAMIDRLLRTHGADPNATIRRKVVYRFHARMAPRWSFGRVFLAGDAAHLTPPFAGQGMNSGIRDAQNLAWKLALVIGGKIGPGLLDSYEQERKPHLWQMIELAMLMGRVMSPRTRLRGKLIQAGFLSLNLFPPAREYITQMRYKPPPRFKAGFLVPDSKGRHSLVGQLLAQPRVRLADGQEVLLDEVLGNRFVLLLRSARPEQDLPRLRQPVWDMLGAARVVLLPAGSPVRVLPEVEVVAEIGDDFGRLTKTYGDCTVLLRPDHYPAAIFHVSDASAAAARIEALLASTWPAAGGGDVSPGVGR